MEDLLWTIVASGFALATVIQIVVWLLFPLRWLFEKPDFGPQSIDPEEMPGVSVIICARNEALNLGRFLPYVLEQWYPHLHWELIVADDASTDNTAEVLDRLSLQYPQLRTVKLPEKHRPGKKEALTRAIRAARYEWILLTDADCRPASEWWLFDMMQAAMRPDTRLVLGFAPMYRHEGPLNAWVRFETAYVAMQYASMAHAGWPYMGVGRNMAFHRALFDAAGGFERHKHLPSGDDDLFVNAVATNANTQLCFQPAAFVYSEGKKTFGSWMRQKARHLSAGASYHILQKYSVGAVAFTHAFHYGLGAALLFSADWRWASLIGYFFRMMVVAPIYWRAFGRLDVRDLRGAIPLLDGWMAVYFGAFAPFVQVAGRGKKRW